jgi:hypothetical protein
VRALAMLLTIPPLSVLAMTTIAGCWIGGVKVPDSDLVPDTGDSAEDTGELPTDAPIPFGFWGLNGFHSPQGYEQVRDQFEMSVFHTSTNAPNYATTTLLPVVRQSDIQVNLRMAGDHHYYTTDQGDFDIEAWKQALDPWYASGVQEFIDDGTLAYHMLIDDLPNFAGRSPTGDELDEMARYSKSLMPGLKVAVREEAIALPVPSSGRYEHVDACINQYVSNDGDVEVFARDNAQLAESMGLELFNGLNIANGGDGSSGQPGWSEGRWAMSAQEIVTYGEALTASPDLVMFLAWEYDGEELWSDGSIGSDYFDQPENTEALRYLALRLAGEEVDPP